MPNPILSDLGFSPQDRVVIFHADDVGMCSETVGAYDELLRAGTLGSAALMVPCPAAREAVRVALEHRDADLGVHLTLTSEWDSYRWGPLTHDPRGGLRDAEGCFPRTVAAVQRSARPAAARRELEAQVAQARAWGVDVTHVDSHMGALAHPKLLPGVLGLSAQRRIPAMYPRLSVSGWRAQGFDLAGAVFAAQTARLLERQGRPLVDHLYMLPLQGGDHLELTRKVLATLPPGITHFILHPAQDSPRLRSFAHDWEGRVANYRAFADPRMKQVIAESGVHAIGYRPLREWWRAQGRGRAA